MYNPALYWEKRGKTPADKFTADKKQFIYKFLEKLDYNHVFEVGCGSGELTEVILKTNPLTYLGCDISEARVEMCRERFPNNHFIQYDITKEEKLSKYDLVICSHVLLHIKPEDLPYTMAKLLSMAKKHLVFFEPNPTIDLGKWQEYNFNHDYIDVLRFLDKNCHFDRFDNLTGLYHVRN